MARLALLLLSALAALCLTAVPASADHRGWHDQPSEVVEPPPAEEDDEEWWPEEEAAASEVIAPQPLVPEAAEPPVAPPLPQGPPPQVPGFEPPVAEEPELVEPPLVTTATVPGRVARVRTDGRAAIPRGAAKRVRRIIAAANQIVGKPYKWGGGHGSLLDRGYDCSGAVGYALIRAGLMRTTMVSGAMARWAAPGAGRWVSVYANKGHVYLEVAGLRLDTSSVGDVARRSGVRWRPVIGRRPGFHARHPVGL